MKDDNIQAHCRIVRITGLGTSPGKTYTPSTDINFPIELPRLVFIFLIDH
jgi:hypothetical protein